LNTTIPFPKLCDVLVDLHRLLSELTHDFQSTDTRSKMQLFNKVKAFFSPGMIDRVESTVPGWGVMIEQDGGVTLVHILTALSALPLHQQYQDATPEHQSILTWAVLFHDIAKRSVSEHSDHTHAFRSASGFVQNLPHLGIAMKEDGTDALVDWVSLVEGAVIQRPGNKPPVQDNGKLPQILAGIDRLLSNNPAAVLISKIILLHHSITSLDEWPQANPLSEDEIREYINPELLGLMQIMALVDNDGWELFEPDNCERYRDMTRRTFAKLQSAIV